MYNSGALIIFTMSCSHHNYFQNIYHPKQTLKPLAINSRYSQPLEFLIIPNLHCFYDLPILGNSHKWIHAVFTKLFHYCQTVFSSNHAVLHSHQKCTIPISTCPQWYFSFFVAVVTLVGMKWCIIVVLISMSLIIMILDILMFSLAILFKGCLLLGRKVRTNLDSILKSRDITLPTKVHLVKAMVFPVVMYGCESWTIKRAEHRRTDAFEL